MDSERLNFKECFARELLVSFFDPDSFIEIGRYMHESQKEDSLICGYGRLNGNLVYAFAQNGSVCRSNVAKMKKIYDFTLKNKAPLVGFYNSNGLDVSEGIQLLNDFGELLYYQNSLSGVVPQLSVIVGNCFSVNAMLACSGDFIIMSDTASCDASADKSVNPAKLGIAHILVEQKEVIREAQKLTNLMNKQAKGAFQPRKPQLSLDEIAGNVVEQNPYAIIENICDKDSISFLFLEFGTNVAAATAAIDGQTVGIVATNGNFLNSDDCVKIARLIGVWDSLDIPIITTINTQGLESSNPCASRDFAKVAHLYAQATVPKIAIITGRAYGAGYVTFASRSSNSDYTIAWPSAIISPLPPHTSVAFLQADLIQGSRTRADLESDYIKGEASAISAARKGVVDDVVKPENTREFLITALNSLCDKQVMKPHKKHSNVPF